MHIYVPAAFAAFSLGITFRSLFDLGWSFIGLLVLLSVLLFGWRLLSRKAYVGLLIIGIFFTGGVARTHWAIPGNSNVQVTGEKVELTGVIVREPDVRDSYVNLYVEVPDISQRILVRADSLGSFYYHDSIKFSGSLEEVQNFEGEGGREFNYRGYLAKDNIYYIVPFPEVEILSHSSTVVGLLLKLKSTYLSSLKKMLPEPSASLAGGITVGERRSLGEQLTQNFRDTGLIHIVVLSGYNIAIIVTAIYAIFFFLPKKTRSAVAIIFIILFTVLVGASSTVVRAAVMGSIGALGVIAGRSSDAKHALILAGFGMLIWNPLLLMYDPSFQLSFIATLGLLLGTPLIVPHLTYIPSKYSLRELAAITISTQIAVYPLLIYMMGTASIVALPVNLLVLPMIPFAMFMVFVTGLLGSIHFTIALPVAYLAQGSLLYIFKVVDLFAALPFAVAHIPVFSFWIVVLAYCLLGLNVWFWHTKQKGDFPQNQK